MVPHDMFTPYGYLDNPYHSWKRNPSGVLRSCELMGMGWHVPNLGSYVRNQFQYTAHLAFALHVEDITLLEPADLEKYNCTLFSQIHTKNRFEYTCQIPRYSLMVRACYFLVQQHALGCILHFSSTYHRPLTVTCRLLHLHTHNPYTSRLWEHGIYTCAGPHEGSALLGIASEGDVFMHGARSADGAPLTWGTCETVATLADMAHLLQGKHVPHPGITQRQEESGWQTRVVSLPCTLTLAPSETRTINAVLARGVSRDEALTHWEDAQEEIALAEATHRAEDEQFWLHAPQLLGDWPDYWRRGFVYDQETLRMMVRPSIGVIPHPWDGMQIQAPREVLAEAAMDMLFLSYADPTLAAEVLLGHFESALHPNLPCMREDGSYNMVADDGQICGTAPEWGFPVWCCDQLFNRMGDLHWLRRLYPHVAAYLRWWLDERRDSEGWLVYACSWESGQDVSSRFGPQQTGGTIIQHVRPVDLQASMAQAAEIVSRWARLLQSMPPEEAFAEEIDFATESASWSRIAHEFTVKTRLLWHDGWFRDYDASAQEWSDQQDTMHLAPIFCGAAGWGHIEQLRGFFAQPPLHSGWYALSWPPVVMTLVGAAAAADQPIEAAELAYQFIDAAYRSVDERVPDAHGSIPGVTREYHAVIARDGQEHYVNAGIEGYGWGALSIDLLFRYLFGLQAQDATMLRVVPMLPQTLRRAGAIYRVEALSWGAYTLSLTCQIQDATSYTFTLQCSPRAHIVTESPISDVSGESVAVVKQTWQGSWGETYTLRLPDLTITPG